MKALKDANNKIIGRTVSASASGQPPISLTTTTQAALSALTAKGNIKRTITIDGTEYDVPDGYTLLDNSGSTATAFYCERNSDSATGTINLTTGVFTASSFTAGNTLPTPDMPLGVRGVGDYVGTKNQLSDYTKGTVTKTTNGLTLTNHGDGSFSFSGTSTAAVGNFGFDAYNNKHIVEGHKYAVLFGTDVTTTNMNINLYDKTAKKTLYTTSSCEEGIFTADATYTDTAFYPLPQANASATGTFYPMIIDLTLMCGEGNEPTTIADVRTKLAEVYGYTADYYPYNVGTPSYKFPMLHAQNCGMVDLGTRTWSYGSTQQMFYTSISGRLKGGYNLYLADSKYTLSSATSVSAVKDMQYWGYPLDTRVWVKDLSFNGDTTAFKSSLSGVYLYYQRSTDTSWTAPTTYTAYADEPLLKVGTYADTLKAIEGKVTRNIGVKVFDGTESWAEYARISQCFYLGLVDSKASQGTNILCSHYQGKAQGVDNGVYIGATNIGSVQCGAFYFTDTDFADVTEWKAYLAAQYAAGTPVTVYYPLATATEEDITALSVTLSEGANYIDAGTDVTPTEMSASYQKTQLIMLNE